MGLVGNMDIVDNMMLRSYRKGNSVFLDRSKPGKLADEIIEELEVVTPSAHTPVRRLSCRRCLSGAKSLPRRKF